MITGAKRTWDWFFLCVARLAKTRLSFPPPSKYCQIKSVTWRCCNIKTLMFIVLVQEKRMAKTQSTQWKSWQWARILRVMAIPQPSAAKICVWAEEHYQHFKKIAESILFRDPWSSVWMCLGFEIHIQVLACLLHPAWSTCAILTLWPEPIHSRWEW